MERKYVLGVDAGSVSAAFCLVDCAGRVCQYSCAPHHGDAAGTLKKLLSSLDPKTIRVVAATSSTPAGVRADLVVDNQVAALQAARRFHHQVGTLLVVGGERFCAIRLSENDGPPAISFNTSCAAGTGGFLDQQAERLGLSGPGELAELAAGNQDDIPTIATRCAVFAKTDLAHAQQQGATIAQICDGLCAGLARNIADTLFAKRPPRPPVIFAGGVSQNPAVARHLSRILDVEIKAAGDLPYPAAGAALVALAQGARGRAVSSWDRLFAKKKNRRAFHFPPLTLAQSRYPDFSGHESYLYEAGEKFPGGPVEVDVYEKPAPGKTPVYVGVDVGSTSTKAVATDTGGEPLAGFYTRTAGAPLMAVRHLFLALSDYLSRHGSSPEFLGVGTTGAGRKFVGAVLNADMAIDEITTHARAAAMLMPEVDTIIEIGGQDAKFTTLANGGVTFCAMNSVCAAGTGSFVEEQAKRLSVPLERAAEVAEGCRAPMASDRCTVFMERDISHCMREGYATGELLAATLHSVCENYLSKVAVESRVGKNVCFQGATGKNRALVAAFEQRLKRPIHVSRYCHLTGALGACLLLRDQGLKASGFRGLAALERPIPLTHETCSLCANHCRITVADVAGERVAYGFLCGREDGDDKPSKNNPSGFDLYQERKKVFSPSLKSRSGPVFGIPRALHLYEDAEFWRVFFDSLGFSTVLGKDKMDRAVAGRQRAGADFCAPMCAFTGQVADLLQKADYVFAPFYLEHKTREKDTRRQYCYYTHFAPTLAASQDPERVLTPLVRYKNGDWQANLELFRMFRGILDSPPGFGEVARAWDAALQWKQEQENQWRETFLQRFSTGKLNVLLLGRPYTVLSKGMGQNIAGLFGALGVRAFYQDMVPRPERTEGEISAILGELHWQYASRILEAALYAAETPDLYPVLVTSFKCSPDSFVADYFRELMEAHGKPYLVLQLDEHGSGVGYETRIEAACRSFENHRQRTKRHKNRARTNTGGSRRLFSLDGRTLFLPSWDRSSFRLLAAALRREGVDARLLDENPDIVSRAMRHNTGQCIPMNIIAQQYAESIRARDLDPARCALWMTRSRLACNLPMFPRHISQLLPSLGKGMDKAGVYVGDISFLDVSYTMPLRVYLAFLCGGAVRSLACRIRPYETEPGAADTAMEQSIKELEEAFLGHRGLPAVLESTAARFAAIPVDGPPRPKVAIFGDLYVRDNEFLNQDLIGAIEAAGGEAVPLAYSDYLKMASTACFSRWLREGQFKTVLSYRAILALVSLAEHLYGRHFKALGANRLERPVALDKVLSTYRMRREHAGESLENLIKVHTLVQNDPGIRLFVQASPAFCCPSLVTEAMGADIQKRLGVPVVTITYDGTRAPKNEAIVPYLECATRGEPATRAA
ncbi:MAG: CoA activase [Deltaproteobacteria bacterium]|nr:CoA activase [Deltaproteobacteria bacterium]